MRAFRRVWISISLIAIGVGIGLLVIASTVGFHSEDIETCSINKTYEGIKNIKMDISYGEVRILEGNEFSIAADNVPEDYFKTYVKDGTWYLTEKTGRSFHLFGMTYSATKMFQWDGHFTSNFTITIPKDFTADNFTLKIGAGDVKAEKISALDGKFAVGAGRLQIHQLSVEHSSNYKVGTGEMILQNVMVNNIFVDSGIGNTKLDGKVTGKNIIKCGIGNVDFELDGDKEDYSYKINSGIGKVELDGDNYHNIDNEIINNNDADNSLNLNCGIGNISVDFN